MGRFVSEDPIGFAAGDVNLSRYVGNGSTNATDPSGKQGEGFGFRQDAWNRHRLGHRPPPVPEPYVDPSGMGYGLFSGTLNEYVTRHEDNFFFHILGTGVPFLAAFDTVPGHISESARRAREDIRVEVRDPDNDVVTRAAACYALVISYPGEWTAQWANAEAIFGHAQAGVALVGPSRSMYVVAPRGAVARTGAESPQALIALNRKLAALEKAQQTAARTRYLPDGRIRYYGPESPARAAGPTRGRSHVTEYDPRTGRVRAWEECYDHSGNVIRVHPKMANGELLDLPHYPPTGSELGR